jgi:two-component system NtrC family sensor kinase
MVRSQAWIRDANRLTSTARTLRRWGAQSLPVAVVTGLLALGAANVTSRAAWREVEDGVLWAGRVEGVVAAEIADGTPAAAVGMRRGDLLLAIDDQPIDDPADVVERLHSAGRDTTLRYTVVRSGSRDVIDLRVAPVPGGPGILYFLLAGVGAFTLLVAGAVRLRRPRDPATLHFLWLSAAFFGVFTFSFSGRLDRLDWVFYWADVVAILLLPPLFLDFTVVFPDRARHGRSAGYRRLFSTVVYAPAVVLGVARALAVARSSSDAGQFVRVSAALDRLELLYLALCFLGGAAVLGWAISRVTSGTARRQLQWIAWGTALGAGPFALGYALPYARGLEPSIPRQLLAVPLSLIPLAYASAIVRYRLRDIEIILKRALVAATIVAVVVGIFAGLLSVAQRFLPTRVLGQEWVVALLGTLVALLLAPWVKELVQTTLDRAFYRDRYDYRRALVGFARDLNSDLDPASLARRLASRVVETLVVDRMAILVADEHLGPFAATYAQGLDGPCPALSRAGVVGRLVVDGRPVTLDDPSAVAVYAPEDVDPWRDAGLFYLIPCVSPTGTTAVLAIGLRHGSEPLSSEDIDLLGAVAGQIATALENARLYRQLHTKAVELDRLRAFNENILESLDDGLLVVDLDDRVVRWNRALELLYGLTRDEAFGTRLDDVFDAPVVETVRAARRDAAANAVRTRIPVTGRGPASDVTRLVNLAVVPLRAPSGDDVTTVGTVVIVQDVTSRVQLEEQLQITEKMASIGLLAAGVAHEVNTPLTGISSFTQMLLHGADPDDPKTRLLEKIERQTFRAAKIVNGLLNLSRPAAAAASEHAVVDVNVVLNDVLGLVEHQFATHRVKVRKELCGAPASVSGVEHKLQQVFLNLLLNAKDAMPRGGWLSLRTAVEPARVMVEVADTGGGIPSEHLARIYDPFFTTKAINQGTGLGLSIAYGIIREHDGTIECDSTVGQGTRFVLSFPVLPARAVSAATRS